MTVGALVLMALDDHTLTAGAFSLSSYINLDPIEQVASSPAAADEMLWDCIDISYSRTIAGGAEQIARLNSLTSKEDVNFHFIICNGTSEVNGNICTTAKWKKQRIALPDRNWTGSDRTIRICVVSDGLNVMPTDCQIKRTAALVEALARNFDITPEKISYPENWKL